MSRTVRPAPPIPSNLPFWEKVKLYLFGGSSDRIVKPQPPK